MDLSPIPYTDTQRKYMIAIYVLFAAGIFLGGLPTIIAVIIAYVKRQEMFGTIYHDHIRFLLRTFWASLLLTLLGIALSIIGIGIVVIGLASIWYIFRIVVGAIRFFDNKSITPTGWFM